MQTSASPSPPDPDALLAEQMARFRYDPLGYVLWVFDWGQGELEGEAGPDKWQAETLRAIGEEMQAADAAVRIAIASGHGIGKTCLTAWVIHWFMATRPGCAGVVTANTRDQLVNKTWRELAKWNKRAINGHWFEWTATSFKAVERPETWFIAAQPWTKERSEAFAGLHEKDVLVLFDEASAIDDAIWDVASGAMTEKGALWLALGNPTRNTGRFKECFGRLRHRWVTRQIDSRDSARANKAEIQQWIDDYGEDSDFVRVRVRGVFPRAGSMQFIPGDVVDEAMSREPVCHLWEPLILGCDVARYGDDQSVIAFRRGRDACSVPWKKYRGVDTMTLAGEIAKLADLHQADAIFVDGVGIGAGVVDRLRQMSRRVFDVQSGGKPTGMYFDEPIKVKNKRVEMWAQMRQWLKIGAIPDDNELEADLTGIEYGYDADNALMLEKVEDMKKRGLASPDNATALALTFAEPVAPKSEFTRIQREEEQRREEGYNVYAPGGSQ